VKHSQTPTVRDSPSAHRLLDCARLCSKARPITIFGYTVQMAAVPALALTQGWPMAAALIILERVGKAIRNPPRDVMLSHAAKQAGGYGLVFGIHEAMDQFGAIFGPLLVALVLANRGSYQEAFAVLLVPALINLLFVGIARWSYPRPQDLESSSSNVRSVGLPRIFWIYLAGAMLVAAGFADYPLIAYHFGRTHIVPTEWIAIFYAVAMAVSGTGSLALGRLFDRWGFRVLISLTIAGFWEAQSSAFSMTPRSRRRSHSASFARLPPFRSLSGSDVATMDTSMKERCSLRPLVRTVSAALLGIVALGCIYLCALQLTGNFNTVVAGEFYRSGQLTAAQFANYAEKYGIKTIINLRGENTGASWYDSEINVTRRLNVAHVDFRMSARRELTATEAATLIALMKEAEKPVLIHCQGGADRSGLASAIYLAAIKRADEATAERQLSVRFGHLSLPFIAEYAMNRTFKALAPSLGFRGSGLKEQVIQSN
jgi:protein tyrosine/serine phosphatase